LREAAAGYFGAPLLASAGLAGAALGDDGAEGAAPDEGLAGALEGAGAVEAGGVAPVFGADGSFFWQAARARAATTAAAMRSVRFIFVLLSNKGKGRTSEG
jgi:hypothetical protein